MELDVISYTDLLSANHTLSHSLITALKEKGIVGISHVPDFQAYSRRYVQAAMAFSLLDQHVKQQYAPNRDAGETEGYELGAEQFKDAQGHWQTDDKKASFYAFVPDRSLNKWPHEVDLQTPYLALGELIFKTGKHVLNAIGVNETLGIHHDGLVGYGRMLHYHKEGNATNAYPNWCGAHFDHGVFTGLMPAYYFRQGEEVEEPQEAGLFIMPAYGNRFEKVFAADKSILLFQAGEFAQLATHDHIRATKHLVKKAWGEIERFTFALFYSADAKTKIYPQSLLTTDTRYTDNCSEDGSILYGNWEAASFQRYRATL